MSNQQELERIFQSTLLREKPRNHSPIDSKITISLKSESELPIYSHNAASNQVPLDLDWMEVHFSSTAMQRALTIAQNEPDFQAILIPVDLGIKLAQTPQIEPNYIDVLFAICYRPLEIKQENSDKVHTIDTPIGFIQFTNAIDGIRYTVPFDFNAFFNALAE